MTDIKLKRINIFNSNSKNKINQVIITNKKHQIKSFEMIIYIFMVIFMVFIWLVLVNVFI